MEIQAVRNDEDQTDKKYIPVMVMDKGIMVCECGYELLKHDEVLYKCAGGGHVYSLEDGDLFYDKFGNPWMRKNFGRGGE